MGVIISNGRLLLLDRSSVFGVILNSGTNTVKLVTTGTEGPNIDCITVTAQ